MKKHKKQSSKTTAKKTPRLSAEDRSDIAVARARRNEPTVPWSDVKKTLKTTAKKGSR